MHPLSVESINSRCFANCLNLKNITLSFNLSGIGDFVFDSCASLKEIYIPDSVVYISDTAFIGCPNITIYARENSYAHKFAIKHGINYSTELYNYEVK